MTKDKDNPSKGNQPRENTQSPNTPEADDNQSEEAVKKISAKVESAKPFNILGETVIGITQYEDESREKVPYNGDLNAEIEINDPDLYAKLATVLPFFDEADHPHSNALLEESYNQKIFQGNIELAGQTFQFQLITNFGEATIGLKDLDTNQVYSNEIYLRKDPQVVLIEGWHDEEFEDDFSQEIEEALQAFKIEDLKNMLQPSNLAQNIDHSFM